MFESLSMFINLGTGEILVIALVILLLFGGKKIPELMKAPIIDSSGIADRSLFTRLLLATILLSGIFVPAAIVVELHIQQYEPISTGLVYREIVWLLKFTT